VAEEEDTTVAVDAVVVVPIVVDVVEDEVEDEVRITLVPPMQKREVCVPILAQMCLHMVKSLQQIKCAPHGKHLYSTLAPTMDKTLKTNCRTRFGWFLLSLCTQTMSVKDMV
jgi:hypothetical protein